MRHELADRKRMIEFAQQAQQLGGADRRRCFRATFEAGRDAPGKGEEG